MTSILQIVQDAQPFIGIDEIDMLFGNTDQEARELVVIANKCALSICERYGWQALTREHAFTGDGATDTFDLPADYLRMSETTDIWSSDLATPYTFIPDLNEFLGFKVREYGAVINSWTLQEDQIKMIPELPAGQDARFLYITKNFAKDQNGTPKARFTQDQDQWRLDDELLRLGLIYQYKAFKKMPYAEEQADFESRLSAMVGSDKPVKKLVKGRAKIPAGVTLSYPVSIKTS